MPNTPGQHTDPDPRPWWQDVNLSEPVRVRLYAVTVAVIAVLVAYGVLDGSHAALWLAVVAAALGVTATEVTRAAVVSPLTARRVAADAAWEANAGTSVSNATQMALDWSGVPRPDERTRAA